MVKIPAGLTSSVTGGGKNFILQTEFIASAVTEGDDILSGRIKTTVAVSGQIVHKVEKAYVGVDSDVDPIFTAEKAVKRQHMQVAKTVSSKPKEFLESVSELTISPEDRLSLIPGIADVIAVDLRNINEYVNNQSADNPIMQNIQMIRDLVIGVTQNTRLGKLQRMIGIVGDKKYILSGFAGGTYFLSLKDNIEVSDIINQLEKVKP